eukprot:m.39311 g.39311  ORF g.39311 m.39311 type:complete len:1107 (+) comp9534_c0_seq1:244-3564(+)
MSTQQEFEMVLQQTTSQEEGPRKQSEQVLEQWINTQPDSLAINLLQSMKSETMMIRDIASVLFRRYNSYMGSEVYFFLRLQPQTQAACKQGLLEALATETVVSCRHKIADCIANLAELIMIQEETQEIEKQGGHPWPELLQSLWQFAQHPEPSFREIALYILSEVPLVFGVQLERYIGEVVKLLQSAIMDADSAVKANGAQAYASFVTCLDTKEKRSLFVPLTPLVLETVTKACVDDPDMAESILQSLVMLVETEPKFLRPNMPVVIEQMYMIASSNDLELGCKRLALEVLMIICEEAPGMAKKFPTLIEKLVPLLIHFCSDIEYDDSWPKIDKSDYRDDDEDNSTVGEQSLDRLALCLGGKIMIPATFKYIPDLLRDADWQRRAAALTTITAIAEGCLEEMRGSLDQIVEHTVPHLIDEHPRVRYAACNTVGQLSLDFAPDIGKEHQSSFQTLYHAKVIPNLLKTMEDGENPRVQAHGAAALVNFCDHATKETLSAYLDSILSRLAQMLSSRFKIVLEHTVSAIATVADKAEHLFHVYYQHFMPSLKQIMVSVTEKEFRLLRGKTLECITFIGLAVGKEMFAQDALDVIQLLQQTQEGHMDADDPQIPFVLAGWARLCEILEEDFIPYLSVVMPPLMRSLQLEAQLKLLDADDDVDGLEGGRENWEVVGIATKKLGIKTSVIEEKRTACEMMKVYVSKLEGGFAPYVEDVSQTMLKLLDFMFDDSIRSIAAAILPLLIISAQSNNATAAKVPQMWVTFTDALIKAANEENEPEALSWKIEAIKDCIEAEPACISVAFLETVAQGISTWLQEYNLRYEDRRVQAGDDDFDQEDGMRLCAEEAIDAQIIEQVSHLMHSLFSCLGEKFLPTFVNLCPIFAEMLGEQRPTADRQYALCVFDDLIESCGQQSVAFANHFLAHMVRYVQDQDPLVRQAASYGVGVLGKIKVAEYAPACREALPYLEGVIQDPASRELQNRNATENAISAILKIVSNPDVGVPLSNCLPMIINWLPITEDQEEAEYIYTFICELMANGDPAMTQECVAKFLVALMQSLGTSLMPYEAEMTQKIINIIEASSANPAILAVMNSLPAEVQQKLQDAIAHKQQPS